MPEIEIRPATLADLETLSKLEHAYTTNYVWQMERTLEEGQVTVSFREVRLPRAVQVTYPHAFDMLMESWNKRTSVLVACLKENPVGYIGLTEEPMPSSTWVSDLLVEEKMRRKGIGTALVLAAQEWSVMRRHQRVVLEMQSKNYPAIRLASKLGYEFCGYNDHYYSSQDIALFFGKFI